MGLDHAVDVDARDVDGIRLDTADVDDVLGLDDCDFGVARHGAVEVLRAEAELHVAEAVRFVRFDEGVVALDAFFHDVAFACEDLDVSWCRVLRDGAVAVVSQGELAGLHDSTKGSGCVEGGYACATGATAFGEGALGGEFELQLAGEIHLLKDLVLADIGCDHLLDLFALQEEPEASADDPGIVGDGSQAGYGWVGFD